MARRHWLAVVFAVVVVLLAWTILVNSGEGPATDLGIDVEGPPGVGVPTSEPLPETARGREERVPIEGIVRYLRDRVEGAL